MGLVLITPPAQEPVALDEARAPLRVDGAEEDTLIEAFIGAAREWTEGFTRRALVEQTWELVLDAFPAGGEIEIPRPPLISVTSLKYKDQDGAESTFPAASYIVDVASQPGRLVLATGQTWPGASLYPAGVIAVRFKAGFGDAAAVPERYKAAIKLLIGNWFENREAVVTGTIATEIPLAVESLLYP